MNRTELENEVAAQIGGAKAVSHKAVDAVLGAIARAVARGEEVRIVGFGAFEVAVKGPSRGRNPRTGMAIEIPERRVVKFKPGSELKKAAANGDARGQPAA